MRVFILVMFVFITSIGFAQKAKNFFPGNHKDVMDLIESMLSTGKIKYVSMKSFPVDNPYDFTYFDGRDSLDFFVREGKWQQVEGIADPPVPPDTLMHYYIETIQGPLEAIFPIWKKYYSPDATEEQIPLLSSILDDTGISGAIISKIKGQYYQIHCSFQPIYKLKTVREGGR